MTTTPNRHFSAFRGQLTKVYGFHKDYRFLDLTLGDGGHTEEALEAGCQVVSFDVDPEAIKRAADFLKTKHTPIVLSDSAQFEPNKIASAPWIVINSNFTNSVELVKKYNIEKFDGIMVDLGPSQYQVLADERGFSFNSSSELDMRIDKNMGVTAKDLINALNEGELSRLFELGDESFAKPIARIIVSQRKISPITTCKQLSDIITRIKRKASSGMHPATQVFMTLRMAVNLERENIISLLSTVTEILKKDGVLGVITFHSTEDRLVKSELEKLESMNIVSVINKKPIEPSIEELKISQRTRSAKLRLVKKYN